MTERRVEIGLLFGILTGLFALVSMVGWNATDPTLLRPSEAMLNNPCGPIGANLADLLFKFISYSYLNFIQNYS